MLSCTTYLKVFFLTPTAEKNKTQAKNSTFGEALFSSKTLKKKINYTNVSPKTDIFSLGTTLYAIFMSKYFKILTISTMVYKKC